MGSGETDWFLSTSTINKIADFTGDKNLEGVSRLWLGYGVNFVAEINSSHYVYNVDKYGSLKSELKHIVNEWATIKVWNPFSIESHLLNKTKQLAMDIKEPGGYILINDRGDSFWRKGSGSSKSRAESWQRFINENRSSW